MLPASSSPLAVSPGFIEVALTPGQTYEGEFLILNPAVDNTTSHYLVSVGSLAYNDASYSPDFNDFSDYNQIVDWISIESPKGELAPQDKRAIKFKITVPADAPAGGQYASLLVSSEDPSASDQTSGIAVAARSRIAILLYSTVSGQTREEGAVLENNVPGVFFNQPIKTSSLITNTGNVHIKARYTLRVYPLFSDEELYTNEESPVLNTVIPDTTLYSEKVWSDTPLLGLFRVQQEIDFNGQLSTQETITLVAPTWFVILATLFLASVFYFLSTTLAVADHENLETP